jgi:tetratricopeptide (TPR) repeat protein
VLGRKHTDTAASYNNIGGVLKAQGQYAEALAYYRKALAIREKVLGREHTDTATSYHNIGAVLHRQGQYAEALAYYRKALAIQEKVLGTEHTSTATSYNNIGMVLKTLGQHEQALAYYRKALTVAEACNDPNAAEYQADIESLTKKIQDSSPASHDSPARSALPKSVNPNRSHAASSSHARSGGAGGRHDVRPDSDGRDEDTPSEDEDEGAVPDAARKHGKSKRKCAVM